MRKRFVRNLADTMKSQPWPSFRPSPRAITIGASSRSDGQVTVDVVRAMSIPDMPSRIMAGLCVPENPIVCAQSETCWPNAGSGAVVAADAPAADSRTVPAARAVARRRRTGFMINAFHGGECASVRRTDVAVSFPAGGILWCSPL